MSETVEKAWFFTAAELYVLLYSRKIEKLPLFEGIAVFVPDERQIVQAAVSLAANGVLSPTDHALVLEKEIRDSLDVLENYDFTVIERTRGGVRAPRCIYVKEQRTVLLSPDTASDVRYRLEYVSLDSLLLHAEEFGLTSSEKGLISDIGNN
ncbi:MAG: hypothetical protein IJP92_06650 [Lachnospiraceae bacterium]|nr:hypothetical protein [Lachnospiraceae bacterium]